MFAPFSNKNLVNYIPQNIEYINNVVPTFKKNFFKNLFIKIYNKYNFIT